jgi:hydrogenase nickel incorporation protein HypA/HybF
MHEMSLIVNLFDILEEQAREKKAIKIHKVKLQVGLLAGAVPEMLKTAFDIYKKDTLASEAELEIQEVPLKVLCLTCRTEMEKDDFIFKCTHCESTDLKTLAGTELLLERLEMEVDS